MNISRENVEACNALIKISIDKQDYEEKVKKSLNEVRKKAQIPGFRPGKVPFSLIEKMYGLNAKLEEINKLVSESLDQYIKDENLNTLGDPIPAKDQEKVDIKSQDSFNFIFEIGLTPEMDFKLSQKDKFVLYDILPDEKSIQDAIDSYRKHFGSFKPCDSVEATSMIKGELTEVDGDGNDLENGIRITDANIFMDAIKDDDIKNGLIGLKKDDNFIFNPKKAYQDDNEVAYTLKIKKEEATNQQSDFRLTIKEISKYEDAAINQDLFDKVFGKDAVSNEEEFISRVKENLKKEYAIEANRHIEKEITDYFIKKTKVELPVSFLKRWLLATNDKLSEEQLEKEFPFFEKDLKWQLIKGKIITDFDLKAEKDEVMAAAKDTVRKQFAYYGMMNVGDEVIEKYTAEMMEKDKKYIENFYLKVVSDKVFETIKANCKIETKEIKVEDYKKLVEKESKKEKKE